jgi:sigma-B regulation protein RsbU (phosphoserine phosphatase)
MTRSELHRPFPPEPACSEPRADHQLWRAVLARDRSFDGRFVFAVRSTGIYCRPSCPAKRPRRDRTLFYPRPADAERAGFRACLRCEPKLFAEAQEKKRLDGELAIARVVQERLAPTEVPAVAGWEVAGRMDPCREVGGDFFDVVKARSADRLFLGLGDVSGKGVGAALLAASLQAAFRLLADGQRSPSEILSALDDHLRDRTPPAVYATLAVVALDAGGGGVTASLAGHPPPLVLGSSGGARWLDAGGPPLALRPGSRYEECHVVLAPEASVLLYTDGLTEAEDGHGRELGASFLERIGPGLGGTAAARVEALRRAVSGAAPSDPTDDRSVLLARRV